jgi:hypothetical protein
LAALLIGALFIPVLDASARAEDGLEPVFGPVVQTYPDLVPDVGFVLLQRQVFFDSETNTWVQDPTTPPSLYFDTRSQNKGTVPMDLLLEEPTNPMSSAVTQCTAWSEGICRERQAVGGFTWHDGDGHTHFHFNDFADYELRKYTKRGEVDWSSRGLIAVSEKVSFCLQDSQTIENGSIGVPRYAGCSPYSQGISPGWTDIYTSDIEGQRFENLPVGIPDGLYALVIDMDPLDRLYESDNDNNLLVVTVRFLKGATEARIVGKSYPNW